MTTENTVLPTEIWKDIPKLTSYQASTFGNIRSLDRLIIKNDGILMKRKGKSMKLTLRNFSGRKLLYITMSINGKPITRGVSTIIAETFIEKPINSTKFPLQVGHQDGNPLNNCVGNLKWETGSENMQHAHRTGLILYRKGGLHFNSKKVTQYNLNGEFIKTWSSVVEAALEFNLFQTNVARCARGEIKSSGGFVWKYVAEEIERNVDVLGGEIWKYLPGSDDFYEVSNYGRIKSIERVVTRKDYVSVKYKSKILNTSIRNGYRSVFVAPMKKRFIIHILVAELFIEKRPSRVHIVDHIDDNKSNNHVDNLQWITRKENIIKAHCCPKRFSSITNFVDFTDLNRCKNAFFDFDPSFI